MRIPKHIALLIIAIAFCTPSFGNTGAEPYIQKFVLTAYYSPLPGQCCYVKGGYVADKILNGEGHTTADGSGVFPGLLAAPPTMAYGTQIDLPGLGTFSVHDRGGAIQNLADGSVRLDVWVGHGEEGLARALAFGVQEVTGTVYPPGSVQPGIQFALEDLEAPPKELSQYLLKGRSLMSMTPEVDQSGLSVVILQDYLRELGYFQRSSSGYFGEETQEALQAFMRDYTLDEPVTKLTERTGAVLLAAVKRNLVGNPVSDFVSKDSKPSVIAESQRILRYLGYYRGRTDGDYSDKLFAAILKFQQDHNLAGDAESPGAGRIGPLTMKALQAEWNRRLVHARADRYLLMHEVDEQLEENGMHVSSFLQEGNYGSQVRKLQTVLAEHGYFEATEVNGSFGPKTKQAVVAYQKDRGIISGQFDSSAGIVGPATLASLRTEQRQKYHTLVRAEGWGSFL